MMPPYRHNDQPIDNRKPKINALFRHEIVPQVTASDIRIHENNTPKSPEETKQLQMELKQLFDSRGYEAEKEAKWRANLHEEASQNRLLVQHRNVNARVVTSLSGERYHPRDVPLQQPNTERAMREDLRGHHENKWIYDKTCKQHSWISYISVEAKWHIHSYPKNLRVGQITTEELLTLSQSDPI